MLELIVGDKNYSSWSMRAWMLLKFAGVEFRETSIQPYRASSREQVRALGGETGLVPVLVADGHPIWDTMAIVEFIHEGCPTVAFDLQRSSNERARAAMRARWIPG